MASNRVVRRAQASCFAGSCFFSCFPRQEILMRKPIVKQTRGPAMRFQLIGRRRGFCFCVLCLRPGCARRQLQRRSRHQRRRPAPLPGLGTVLIAMGEANTSAGNAATAHPLDIIGLEETTSNAATVAPLITTLNSFYGAGTYSQLLPGGGSFQASTSGGSNDGNGPNAIVYNTTTMKLLAASGCAARLRDQVTENYRQVARYEFQPVGVVASQDFYVYVSHMKSSYSGTTATNEQLRGEEAAIIRSDEDTLGAGASFLTMGDFNLDSSGEAAYTTLTAGATSSSPGQNVDPQNLSNASISFTGTSYKANETDSVSSLKYRDDIQFQSGNINAGTSSALNYLSGSYRVFGNNNTVAYGGSVTSSSNTALSGLVGPVSGATAEADLGTASDHYPVDADYTLVATPEPVGAALILFVAPILSRRRRRDSCRVLRHDPASLA